MIGSNSSLFQEPLNDSNESFDLTALMDVIFILLIFFILTSGITQISTEVNLPKSKELLKNQSTEEVPVIIEMYHQRKVLKINDEEFETIELAKDKLLDFHKEKDDRLFIIAPEKTLPSEKLIQLLNFFSANQISNLQIVSEWSP